MTTFQNKTTNFSAEAIYNMPTDEINTNITHGLISWGDISWAQDIMAPTPRTLPPMSVTPSRSLSEQDRDAEYEAILTWEEDILENWSVPDITLRKGIWENFPVSLVPIVDGDGTDRYAVVWHRKNLEEWARLRAETFDEYQEYDGWCEWRLRFSLNHYSHKYAIEEPRDSSMIMVIAMVHPKVSSDSESDISVSSASSTASEEETASASEEETASADANAWLTVKPAKFADLPKLTRLNDIKNNFPVVWHETQGKCGKKLYVVELFGKKIKELSLAAGYDKTEDISGRLIASLKASKAWRVSRAESPREFCRLELS